ncbi:hypothetical protein Pcac1_g8851 [Phytophthora cactorum]|nr:hypothetical protein Pcac1_g8851 [Phytophthora cactorum]
MIRLVLNVPTPDVTSATTSVETDVALASTSIVTTPTSTVPAVPAFPSVGAADRSASWRCMPIKITLSDTQQKH